MSPDGERQAVPGLLAGGLLLAAGFLVAAGFFFSSNSSSLESSLAMVAFDLDGGGFFAGALPLGLLSKSSSFALAFADVAGGATPSS